MGNLKGNEDTKDSHTNVDKPENPTPLDLGLKVQSLLPNPKNAFSPG
jgi:hypothetical protein